MPLTVLAVSTGTWAMLAIVGVLLLVGLIAVARTEETPREDETVTVYVFGLGKHPRLVRLPEARDLPATPEPLEGDGLRALANDAVSKTSFRTTEYRLQDGRTRPFELSEDLPRSITEIELARGELTVRVDRDGRIEASRPLEPGEREALEELFVDIVGEAQARADRRTWDTTTHSAREANTRRV